MLNDMPGGGISIMLNYIRILVALMCVLNGTQIHGQEPKTDRPKTIIESNEGRKYEVVRISKKTADSITFSHPGGIVTFHKNELTYDSQELLGFGASSQPAPKSNNLDLSKPLPNFSSQQSTPSTRTACSSCRGHKVISCTICLGSGFGQDTQKYEPCSKCGGLGKYSKELTRTYDAGVLKKNKTHVIGHSEVICEKCKGQGKIGSNTRSYCQACSGRGQIKCPSCK